MSQNLLTSHAEHEQFCGSIGTIFFTYTVHSLTASLDDGKNMKKIEEVFPGKIEKNTWFLDVSCRFSFKSIH